MKKWLTPAAMLAVIAAKVKACGNQRTLARPQDESPVAAIRVMSDARTRELMVPVAASGAGAEEIPLTWWFCRDREGRPLVAWPNEQQALDYQRSVGGMVPVEPLDLQPHAQAELLTSAQLEAEVASLRAEIARVEQSERDNHHNALACSYCNPDKLVLVPPPASAEGVGETAIRARLSASEQPHNHAGNRYLTCAACQAILDLQDRAPDDIRALLAQVEALRAELARVTAWYHEASIEKGAWRERAAEAEAQIATLQQERDTWEQKAHTWRRRWDARDQALTALAEKWQHEGDFDVKVNQGKMSAFHGCAADLDAARADTGET